MTTQQIISSGMALAATLYYGQALFRKDFFIKGSNAIIWAAIVIWCAVAWFGTR